MASKVATMVGAPPPPSVLAPRAKGLVDAIALLEMGHRKALADIELVLEAGAVSLLGRAAVAAAAAAGDLEEGEPHATHAFLRKMHPALERLRTDLQARRAAVGALEAEYAAAVAVATAAAGGRGGGGATQKEERKGTDGPAADSLAAHMATLSGWLRGHVAGNITPPPGALPAEVLTRYLPVLTSALSFISLLPANSLIVSHYSHFSTCLYYLRASRRSPWRPSRPCLLAPATARGASLATPACGRC